MPLAPPPARTGRSPDDPLEDPAVGARRLALLAVSLVAAGLSNCRQSPTGTSRRRGAPTGGGPRRSAADRPGHVEPPGVVPRSTRRRCWCCRRSPVKKVFVKEGDEVSRGEVLIEFDSDVLGKMTQAKTPIDRRDSEAKARRRGRSESRHQVDLANLAVEKRRRSTQKQVETSPEDASANADRTLKRTSSLNRFAD